MSQNRDPRTNAEWLSDLRGTGHVRDEALSELRSFLVTGLARAFQQSDPEGNLAEDSVQDALVLILDRLGSFRGDSKFTTWAMSVAMRVALSEVRRARWRDVSLDQMVEAGRLGVSASPETPASSSLERLQLLEAVRGAIDHGLTDRQREAILAELAGVPPGEIAARMGTNRNALYKLVYDARVRLKEALQRAGWTAEHVLDVLGGR